ncbi:uncharacterized protein LOC118477371 [Aplysia californica]|uniref:Uncharacterized protein LOC118477371 n=1 Tax=Aplysia californica TaxID=6500 RepID=A0ABM1VQ83_APLCA|nr:uncharacterized protein LOC118477371 [Aplysia californica]
MLRDSVIQGSLIRNVLTLTVGWDPYSASSRTVVSNYVVIPEPKITVRALTPLTQPIMGIFKTHVIHESSRQFLQAKVECLTPYENVSNEVMLTVQLMEVSLTNTEGISEETRELLEDWKGALTSTLGSYQNNKAILQLPRIPLDSARHDNMTVTSTFRVRVEDYSDLKDGAMYEVKLATSFRDVILWAGLIPVTLDAPDVRMPDLWVSMSQAALCSYDAR